MSLIYELVSCSGKVNYESRKEAQKTIRQMKQRSQNKRRRRSKKKLQGLHVYECDFCGYYHVGHKS